MRVSEINKLKVVIRYHKQKIFKGDVVSKIQILLRGLLSLLSTKKVSHQKEFAMVKKDVPTSAIPKIKVALIVGHSRKKQGAEGSAGESEFMFYKNLAPEIVSSFHQNPSLQGKVQVKVFFRDETAGYVGAMHILHKDIDTWGADLSISLHFNAALDPSINGHEVLYCNNSSRGHKYANSLCKILHAKIGTQNRGPLARTKQNRGGQFLCLGKSACILIEPFFAAHQLDYMPGHRNRELLIASLSELVLEAWEEEKVPKQQTEGEE